MTADATNDKIPATAICAPWLQALRSAVVLTLLCGIAYPTLAVSVAAALFPYQARGSLITRQGRLVGSRLVGQRFLAPEFFHGRPSAVHYNPFDAGGSNLAPSNPALRRRAKETSRAIAVGDGVAPGQIPVDLIAASGSGIDPDISPAAAYLQVNRVAAARNLPRHTVAALVRAQVVDRTLGVLGQARVNVLLLNLRLEALGAQALIRARAHRNPAHG